jgi:hypothetical protein
MKLPTFLDFENKCLANIKRKNHGKNEEKSSKGVVEKLSLFFLPEGNYT